MYVLNRELQPVPAGVTGDLYIGGVQLARGYHGRPDLTNERFLPDPFRKDTGSRIYKTGDLARYGPDGRLEYAGRSDDQIKLRGFRIELGEIEAAMLKHSEVVESAVVVREDGRAGKRLIGYWTSKKPGRVSGAELRSFLKRAARIHGSGGVGGSGGDAADTKRKDRPPSAADAAGEQIRTCDRVCPAVNRDRAQAG